MHLEARGWLTHFLGVSTNSYNHSQALLLDPKTMAVIHRRSFQVITRTDLPSHIVALESHITSCLPPPSPPVEVEHPTPEPHHVNFVDPAITQLQLDLSDTVIKPASSSSTTENNLTQSSPIPTSEPIHLDLSATSPSTEDVLLSTNISTSPPKSKTQKRKQQRGRQQQQLQADEKVFNDAMETLRQPIIKRQPQPKLSPTLPMTPKQRNKLNLMQVGVVTTSDVAQPKQHIIKLSNISPKSSSSQFQLYTDAKIQHEKTQHENKSVKPPIPPSKPKRRQNQRPQPKVDHVPYRHFIPGTKIYKKSPSLDTVLNKLEQLKSTPTPTSDHTLDDTDPPPNLYPELQQQNQGINSQIPKRATQPTTTKAPPQLKQSKPRKQRIKEAMFDIKSTKTSVPLPSTIPTHKYDLRSVAQRQLEYNANKYKAKQLKFAYLARNNNNVHYLKEKIHYLNELFEAKNLYLPKTTADIDNMTDEHKDKWIQSIIDEITALKDNETFSDIDFDFSQIPKSKIVPSQLVFDIRKNPDGTIKKYKCRLVARGDLQGWDTYNDTFADTVSTKSVNMLFSIAAKQDLVMESIDIKTAFLYSKMTEEVYLKRPKGLDPKYGIPEYVKLNKCLYGLKQAAHEWRNTLHKELIKIGFSQIISDNCVYHKQTDSGKIILALHVDDVLVAASNQSLIDQFNNDISKTFELSINNPLSTYLGMSITRNQDAKTISLSQPGYISELLAKYPHLSKGIHPNTPMTCHPYKSKINTTEISLLSPLLTTEYMSKVGSLMYLAVHTRPDIAFAIGQCARHMQHPTIADMTAVDRIISYIAGTKDLSLTFHGDDGSINLLATVDASFACHEDRKSHYGITLHLSPKDASFHTISKKAQCVALSSTEAEYLALCEASKLVAWGRQFLNELGFIQDTPSVIHEDNKSTIHMVYNGNDKGRTKHIDIRFHYIREMIANQQVSVTYLNTEDMISDMLTKPLEPRSFLKHRDNLLGNHNLFFKEILQSGETKVISSTKDTKICFHASSNTKNILLSKIS